MIEITSPVKLANARRFSSNKSEFSNISHLIILYATEFRVVILEVAEMKYMHFATKN
jgi:hypothetical protein